MRPVVIDFETFFSRKDYSLSKMTTESYIRDPRFEAHGAAIKWQSNIPARWYNEHELRVVLKNEDFSDIFLIAHHMQFDGLILSHHYGVIPAMYGCTLSMGRLLVGQHLSVALGNLTKYFGLGSKTIDYFSFEGKHWHELTSLQQESLAEGCCTDVEITWQLFLKLLHGETINRGETS